MKPEVAVALVFLGCCTNVVFLELLIKDDPGCGNLITFAQFLFIAVEGFIFTSKFCTETPNVSVRAWFILVVMFFIVSVTNNYALNFNIPLPLHMVFRASSLMANMLLGIIILKKTYTLKKYIAVIMVSVGIAACTVESGKNVKSQTTSDSAKSSSDDDTSFADFLWWLVGISLLTFAMFMSARMGIYQEVIYKRYGKHPREALFYTHALPLPGFLLLYRDLLNHATIMNNSPLITIPLIGTEIPRMWLYLLGNILTQYVCISAVYVLTTECQSLTVTLVVTLRKFVSLLFSIMYFKNPFTVVHWIGTTLVFSGTLLFADVTEKILERLKTVEKKKED